MNKEIAQLFDRFYSIALKDKIHDPLINSEWNYFQSMIASNNFERDRINMYLGILENERKKKESVTDICGYALDTKLEKRYSEPSKNEVSGDFGRIRTNQDNWESERNAKVMTPKDNGSAKKYSALESKENLPFLLNPKTKSKSEKPDFKKLYEAANSLLRLFESNLIDG